MKNILLPTDFSENSMNAIQYAIQFHEKSACNFFVLHVIKLDHFALNATPFLMSRDYIDDLYILPTKARLRKTLQYIHANFSPSKAHKFFILTDYNPLVEAIRQQVSEKNIDMILMGTKGATGLKKMILGSNAGDIITKVHCTTLVVPENAKFKKLNEIAFPTDYSLLHNINVLQPMIDIVENTNAALRILHINKKNAALDQEQEKNKELLEDYLDGHEYSFHFLSNKKVEDAVECFVESRDIDLIAMVAKNLNYFQQILFHSKIENISYHTDVPFLVLH